MNSLLTMKNILKCNYSLKSKIFYSKKISTKNNNYTLRVDIKNPPKIEMQNIKSFDNNVQKLTDDKISKKITQEDINKPFGTNEYNYTLTSASSISDDSSTKSKRI